MWAMVVPVIVGLAGGAGFVALISQPGGGVDARDSEIESEGWRRVDAEVVSVLRTSSRTFLLVRYVVGTTLMYADVRYPLTGVVPCAGQRVGIRVDPMAPARAAFDSSRPSRTVRETAHAGRTASRTSRTGAWLSSER